MLWPTMGPRSLQALSNGRCDGRSGVALDGERGTAIVVEGLLNYFDRDTVMAMSRRASPTSWPGFRAVCISAMPLSAKRIATIPGIGAFMRALSAFARGRVHIHFERAQDARAALLDCGFDDASVDSAAGILAPHGIAIPARSAKVGVLQARVTRPR